MSSNPERDSLAILAERGVVQEGTILELVPFTWPHVPLEGAKTLFQAEVVNPQGGPDALRWPMDGQRYSAQSLLSKLEQEHGVCGIPIVYRNWRIVGHEESIWREAAQFAHSAEMAKNGVSTSAAESEAEAEELVDEPREPSPRRRILIVAAKVLSVAVVSALGAKFGGWMGGVLAGSIAGAFAVATMIRSDGVS